MNLWRDNEENSKSAEDQGLRKMQRRHLMKRKKIRKRMMDWTVKMNMKTTVDEVVQRL